MSKNNEKSSKKKIIELCHHDTGKMVTWTLDAVENMKIKMFRESGRVVKGASKNMSLEGLLINGGNHIVCCGQVHRTSRFGRHLAINHPEKALEPRICQICGVSCAITDLKSHAEKHATVQYQMFWMVNQDEGQVVCPECEGVRHLNRFNVVSHMKEKHGWSKKISDFTGFTFRTREAFHVTPGGKPFCGLCQEAVFLYDLNKHIGIHSLTHFLVDVKPEKKME